IDLLFGHRGNPDYDLDGDGDTDQADADYLIRTLLRSEYGDANLDRHIDLADFTYVAANFNLTGKGWGDGDFNGDGKVDLTDFAILATNFNFTGDAASLGSAVPEPATGAVLMIAVMLLRRWRQASVGRGRSH